MPDSGLDGLMNRSFRNTMTRLTTIDAARPHRSRRLPCLLAGVTALLLAGCHTPCGCSGDQTALNQPERPAPVRSSIPAFEPVTLAGFDPSTAPRYVGDFEPPQGAGGSAIEQGSLTRVSFATVGSDFDPTLDASGQWLAFASTQNATTSDIYRKTIDGRTVVRLTSDPGEDSMPAWSPDGRSIAFASNRSGSWDLWIMTSDGEQPTQLTSSPDQELHPSFSADGRSIAYCRQNPRSGRWEIWAFDLERPGAHAYVCEGLFPQWSPEPGSRTLLFQTPRERGSRFFGIWTIEFEGGRAMRPTQIVSATDAAVMHPAWSPDGQSLCFCTALDPDPDGNRLQKSDIWVVGVDGTGRTPLTSGQCRNMQPTWGSNGRIFFVSDRSGQDSVWSIVAPEETGFGLGILAIGEDDPAE